MIIGYDVSHHQNPSLWDWGTLAQKARFLIARATYGKGTADRFFTAFAAKARETGIVFGAYLFYRQTHSVDDQLFLFDQQIKAIGGLKDGELLPVLDMEENTSNGDGKPSRLRFSEDCKRIAELWRDTYGGCILYYSSYFPEYLDKEHRVWMQEKGYFHWLADYNREPGAPRHPYTPIWHLHQPKPRAVSEYAQGKFVVDLDVVNPAIEFDTLLIGHATLPPPKPTFDLTTVEGVRAALNFVGCTHPPDDSKAPTESRRDVAAIGYFQGLHYDNQGNRLSVDGIVGPKTRTTLERVLKERMG